MRNNVRNRMMTIAMFVSGVFLFTGYGCSQAMDDSSEQAESKPSGDEDASFLAGGGKADGLGLRPGTPEADGVLELANNASFEVLDDAVGLDRRAAENIVAYRKNHTFETLQELDQISWVGPHAAGTLLEYAKQNGYVDGVDANVHGIEVGSPWATGVLNVANEVSLQMLDDNVALDARAAKNIVDYRNGDDGTPDTSDDRTFDSLDQLAAIDWVAQRAFDKMLSWAKSHNRIPNDWPGLFKPGAVDATFEVVSSSCTRESCRNTGPVGTRGGHVECDEYRSDLPSGPAGGDLRVTGENPGILTIEYQGSAWTSTTLDSVGRFVFGDRRYSPRPRTHRTVRQEGLKGRIYGASDRHSLSYFRYYKRNHRNYGDYSMQATRCDLSVERID